MSQPDLVAHFPAGATPRREQARLLAHLAEAIAEAEDDPNAPRVFLVEAPPGVGKSHLAMALARWSGDAYLLTSQKLLQDQYQRDFSTDLQIVKGRDNYVCERYPDQRIPTSQGMCRRPRGPACQCPYVRAKAAALAGPIFCTNTAYFATLRHWYGEHLPRRRLLVIDEAHNLEAQLVGVLTASFTGEQMKDWFGAPLPRFDNADDYRSLMAEHLGRMEAQLQRIERELERLRPPEAPDTFLALPPSREEQRLIEERDRLQGGLASIRYFVNAEGREWVVRYPPVPGATLELIPLAVGAMAPDLLWDAAEITVLSSAYLGRRELVAEAFGLEADRMRGIATGSPFAMEQRPLVYRPVGRLSRATLPALEPALFAEIATILRAHSRHKGLVHAASYAAARRLVHALAQAAPDQAARLIFVDAGLDRARALELHRASTSPTVLVSPSLREGVDLPDDFLRFQIITKMPFPDLGDPWTAARQRRDPRWYAQETAKALVQAYGRSCRHAGDYGTTYVLDGQFARFVTVDRVLLPGWFTEAADAALRDHRRRSADAD